MKYIDLSHVIKNNMPTYPGDRESELSKVRDWNQHGYNSYELSGTMHLGTHIDCPMHMLDDKNFICNYPVERFLGNAVLIDVRGQKEIDLKDDYFKSIKENAIVLLYTDFDSKYGTAEYYEGHPIITKRFAEFLVRKRIKMLGMDTPSPDRAPYDIHKILLENEIFILENLTNLNNLLYVDEFEVYAQPLNIEAEASYVRAVACYQGY